MKYVYMYVEKKIDEMNNIDRIQSSTKKSVLGNFLKIYWQNIYPIELKEYPPIKSMIMQKLAAIIS